MKRYAVLFVVSGLFPIDDAQDRSPTAVELAGRLGFQFSGLTAEPFAAAMAKAQESLAKR